MTEPYSCIVCGNSRVHILGDKDGYKIWECDNCYTDFVWPMPTKEELKNLYDDPEWFEGGLYGGYEGYDSQTEHSVLFFNKMLDEYGKNLENKTILDVGCGYGNHLLEAAKRGWECFGIETSEHARTVATERLKRDGTIVGAVGALPEKCFDLIIMFDVIEHLPDPYRLMFDLFAKGAISKNTEIIITTPNAKSASAIAEPINWQYRHPPSHLVYFSAESLRFFFDKLLFTEIHFSSKQKVIKIDDDLVCDVLNKSIRDSEGIVCTVKGSKFRDFMQERYVPGTWSVLAEYEHLPRYHFSQSLCQGKYVLDFGCGTGYGSRMLSDEAKNVVGLDIDPQAIKWADSTHQNDNLSFICSHDLGASFDDHVFDVITCFEMIEHVDMEMQLKCLSQFKRLLKPNGMLVISTPNPEITAEYVENPYHIYEMTLREFEEFLKQKFSQMMTYRQWVSPCVTIAGPSGKIEIGPLFSGQKESEVAYISVCSNNKLPEVDGMLMADLSFNFIKYQMGHSKTVERMKKSLQKQKSHEKTMQRLQEKNDQLELTNSMLKSGIMERKEKSLQKQKSHERVIQRLQEKNDQLELTNNTLKTGIMKRKEKSLQKQKSHERAIQRLQEKNGQLKNKL